MEKVLAAVKTGPSKIELREYDMPEVPDDCALLKMVWPASAAPTSRCTRTR